MQIGIVVLMSITLFILLVVGGYIVYIRKEFSKVKFRLLLSVLFACLGFFAYVIGSLCN